MLGTCVLLQPDMLGNRRATRSGNVSWRCAWRSCSLRLPFQRQGKRQRSQSRVSHAPLARLRRQSAPSASSSRAPSRSARPSERSRERESERERERVREKATERERERERQREHSSTGHSSSTTHRKLITHTTTPQLSPTHTHRCRWLTSNDPKLNARHAKIKTFRNPVHDPVGTSPQLPAIGGDLLESEIAGIRWTQELLRTK